MKHSYICPDGLHYDSSLKLCNWPHIAGCDNKFPISGTNKGAQAVTSEISNIIPKDMCTSNGLYADPANCRNYYWCQDGKGYRFSCGMGQFFEPTMGLCYYGTSTRCTETPSAAAKTVEDFNIAVSSFLYPETVVNEDSNNIGFNRYNIELSSKQFLPEEDYKIVCYFTSWAFYRKGDAKFVPEHIDSRLCTHIVYAYASLDPDELVMKPFDIWADIENNFYQRLTSLHGPRIHGADVKVLLALGGWTDSTGDKYSRLVSDGGTRRKFVASVVSYLRRHNFKGLHLDWNYPKCWQSNCNKGPASDKANFAKLIQELSKEFQRQQPPLVLAVALSGYKEVIEQAYDLAVIGRYAEFMSVMTYDYHGAWENILGHVSPLYYRSGDQFPQYNTNYTMEHLVRLGAPRHKLLVGIPFYGQSFTMGSRANTEPGAPSKGPGSPGKFTNQPGMLAYYEICDTVRSQHWTVGHDRYGATGPYAYSGDQWVGYEDVESVKEKAKYIKNMGFGGAMAWTVDLDDFNNLCCREPFPLLRTINRILGNLPEQEPTRADCTKPPAPITPQPPTLTTGVDIGEISSTPPYEPPTSSSTTWPDWTTSSSSATWRPTSTTTTTTTTPPWWRPPTTTTSTPRPTTTTPWWQRPTTTTKTTTPRPTTTTTTTQRPTTITTTTTRRPSTTTSVITKPPTTALPDIPLPGAPCNAGEYLPDPSNCNAYYRCILGELRKEYCAGGLHWNTQSKVCDWPSEAKCEKQSATLSTTETSPWWTTAQSTSTTGWDNWWTSTTTTTTTTHIPDGWWTTTKKSTTTSRPSTEIIVSTERCSNGQYYPDPGSCTIFYICVNGTPVKQTCAPGLVWNQAATMCDWTFNTKCANSLSLPHEYPQYLKIKKGSSCNAGDFSSAQDCTKYLVCIWGTYQEFSCGPGLHWNNAAHLCDWPRNAQCKSGGDDLKPTDLPTVRPTPPTTKPTRPPTWSTQTTLSSSGDVISSTPSLPTVEPTRPPQGGTLSGYFKVICYFTNWAWYRPGIGKYLPETIDERLCTHIVYGFAVLDYENLIVKAHDSWADYDNKFYERVVAYKKKGLKVSLALGGWNDSAGDKYSRLVNSPSARRRFVKHVTEFLEKHGFDGLDLDWEYPKCWQVDCNKGPDSDKAAFAALIRELRQAFNPKGLLLSSAVSPSKSVVDAGYDVKALGENLDWVAIMTYDFHGQWDKKTGHLAPLYFHPDDDFFFFNANYSINYWISEGVPRRKIVMGMPLYGQSFQLADSSTNGLNARAPGPGQAGEFTRAAGFLAYYEICDRVKNRGWTVVQDSEKRMGPYAFHGNQWVSYDDAATIRTKSEYIRKMGLGGGMVWALDLDDFRNQCGEGVHPLLNTIREVLADPPRGGTEEGFESPKPPKAPTVPVSTESLQQVSTDAPSSGSASEIDLSSTATVTPATVGPISSGGTSPTGSDFKVVCYFTNWAWYRQGVGKYLPSDIDAELCTHIVYGFAVLNGDQLIIKPHDSWADLDNKFYEKVAAYKAKGLKVLVAIGGWNDSAGDKYSRLVNNPSARSHFISYVTDFIEKHNFDGLDLDWEYPKCWQVDCRKGPDSDKAAFAAFVRELRAAFRPKGYMLTTAVSPSKVVIDAGYDVPTLSENMDWIAVMTYDYHGQWDKITGHVAPMYPHPDDIDVTFNANFSINYWIKQGADPKKIVMGMPMYGQSFSLADNNNHGLNAPTYGGGEAGDSTRARGFLSYYEICTNIQKRGWKVVKDPEGRMGPYAYSKDQWVSFDDAGMIRYKSNYIRHMGLGGGMIWALDLDDFRNACSCEPYPLLRTINRVLRGYPGPGPKCDINADGSKEKIPDNHVHYPSWTLVSEGLMRDPTCGGKIFAPHPSDCQKYYLCQFGVPTEQTCPGGLYWNKDHCDWAENTKCKSVEAGSGDIKPTTSPPTFSPTPTFTELTTATKPSTPGTDVTVPPKPADTGYKVICYFTNWAFYRQGVGKYVPEDIDSSLCTHIAYGFAVMDGGTLNIKPHDSWADIDNNFYHKVTGFKSRGVKVLIAIGGWNDSLGDKYSRLVNSPSSRANFIRTVLEFIEKYGFDGLDLDWEYPKCWQVDCNAGPDSDKEGFAALVQELSSAFKPKGLLLSSAVSPSKVVIDVGYDVPKLTKYFDWISVMTYDFHGHWDKQTGHVAPLYYYPGDTYDYFNANFSINYWLEKGADRKKIIMGMPMYGQSFTLADANKNGLNAKTYGPGQAGEFTRAGGFLAYYEICHAVKSQGYTQVRDPEGRIGPYAYKGNQWVSYDDVSDIRRKSQYIKKMDLGGGMIWALDLDDFKNRCGCGIHPLLKTINHELRGLQVSTSDCT
ncbi:putative chitinase 10 [Cryptotermes secundus]|uniref:chitinase n=2 Tax=Cryptotermes secundus TaxID=105785 RepID=A0A2J7PKL3_9NEOP|nr:putative chitinase 10 [Cryptotermes secundus]